jgi:hypothetical protein
MRASARHYELVDSLYGTHPGCKGRKLDLLDSFDRGHSGRACQQGSQLPATDTGVPQIEHRRLLRG